MKLSVLQENLATALTHVSRFVTTKAQLPILGHVLLSTDSGRLKLSATNLEMGINYTIGAKIDTEGSLTLPAKDITEFVSYLSPGKIDLSLDDKRLLSVVSPRAKTLFATAFRSCLPTSMATSLSFRASCAALEEAVAVVDACVPIPVLIFVAASTGASATPQMA